MSEAPSIDSKLVDGTDGIDSPHNACQHREECQAMLRARQQGEPFGWWVETRGENPDDTARQFVRDPKFIDKLRSHGLTFTVAPLYTHAERPASCLDYQPGELDHSAPARIWLQIDTDGDRGARAEPWPGADGVTWHDESIGGLEIQYIRADLATDCPTVPDGYALVPRDLTAEMVLAATHAHVIPGASYTSLWRAMLGAASQLEGGE